MPLIAVYALRAAVTCLLIYAADAYALPLMLTAEEPAYAACQPQMFSPRYY